ncbi:MAG: ABC transporter permease [Thermoleophilia bacterium]
MLSRLLPDQLLHGLGQAAGAGALAVAVVLLARRERIFLGGELAGALARGLVQIVAMGSALILLLRSPDWTGIPVLLGMLLAAAGIARRRLRGIAGAYGVALRAILLGSGLVIAPMTALGVIEPRLSSLIPVGSMIIANSMNSCALALERFRADVEGNTGRIEAALALGAGPAESVRPYARAAVEASLLPHLNTLRSLGIVWIPGLMAGMVLSGSDPVYAAVYQFAVIAMIFAAGGLTSLAGVLFARPRFFSGAEQLLVRPARKPGS